MRRNDLEALLPKLETFHARFGGYFCRSEGRTWARRYLEGLVLPIERKNVENIAERVGAPARKLQEFLSDSPWDDQGCIEELQRFVNEHLGADDAVLILDDTGFAKKGTRSAGVGRQYSGTMGRVDNCQIGVFMGYASSKGHTLIDRGLYIPEPWFTDAARRHRRSAIPEELHFRTKHEIALAMVAAVVKRAELPFLWVAGDAAYGDSHDIRQAVTDSRKLYCFEVSSNTQVWEADPNWEVPESTPGRGRPRTQPRPTVNSPAAVTVSELAAMLAAKAWVRHRVTEGAKGPREYEFAMVRVMEKRHRGLGPSGWMMARRPIGAPAKDAKYFLSNAPERTPLEDLARVGCLRWTVEENFEDAKGELGLDHYEVTKHRGWYHHVTLVLLALAFLKSVQTSWSKKTPKGERGRDPAAARRGSPARRMVNSRGHRVVPRPAAPKTLSAGEPPKEMAA